MARLVSPLVLLLVLALAQPAGGAVPWGELRRPLHLPQVGPGEPCPVSAIDQRVDWEATGMFGGSGIGRGPVYPGLGGSDPPGYFPTLERFPGGWLRGKLYWYVRPSYRGRVLIRGDRLDGPGALAFPVSRDRTGPGLRIDKGETVGSRPPGSRGVPSSTLVRSRGCYAVQMDGRTFSRIAVFTSAPEVVRP